MANRHLARSVVLQTLFEWDATSVSLKDALIILARNIAEFGGDDTDHPFMEGLLKGVLSRKEDIDLVIEKFHHPPVFIEIKSSNKIKGSMLSPLISIVREIKGAKGFCLCQEKTRRKVENILVLPWQETRSALEEVFGV